ncbi:hypothetical protein WISP_21890 [Willisornis vidua]|uniref:Uncharacterized protein n=1 Tax=Willisornis vidua TaxID=1566151 RepID=A0ABQ9DTP2_9PASS|nr:hypothetical protein WISP_21890 [Willisornis vidua]
MKSLLEQMGPFDRLNKGRQNSRLGAIRLEEFSIWTIRFEWTKGQENKIAQEPRQVKAENGRKSQGVVRQKKLGVNEELKMKLDEGQDKKLECEWRKE